MSLDFNKRQGASMINVLVFFVMAIMVASQTFFFTASSMEVTTVRTETAARKFAYERYLYEALEVVRNTDATSLQRNEADSLPVSYSDGYCDSNRNPTKVFFEQRKTNYSKTGNNVCYEIYDLNYQFEHAYKVNASNDLELALDFSLSQSHLATSWEAQRGDSAGTRFFDKLNQIAFPSMGENHYLIRVYEKYTDDETERQKLRNQRLMYQVVVKKNGTNTPKVISFQEVWY